MLAGNVSARIDWWWAELVGGSEGRGGRISSNSAIASVRPKPSKEVKIGDQTYVKVGETYYQPVKVDGKDKYEVAQVEQGEQ